MRGDRTVLGWRCRHLIRDARRETVVAKQEDDGHFVPMLCIALLAIFDTQVLSIFRRQKEIGMYIAWG